MDRVETQKFLDDLRVKVLNKTATNEEIGRFLDITADLMGELIAVVEKQDTHISSLEKRVAAQGKVVQHARNFDDLQFMAHSKDCCCRRCKDFKKRVSLYLKFFVKEV